MQQIANVQLGMVQFYTNDTPIHVSLQCFNCDVSSRSMQATSPHAFAETTSCSRSNEVCEVATALMQLAACSEDVQEVMKSARTIDKSVQVNTEVFAPRKFKLLSVLTTDTAVFAFTGVKSRTALTMIANEVEAIDEMVKNTPVLDRVVLVLMKLKLCLSFTCLAALFGVSWTTLTKNFNGTLSTLAAVLEAAISWPKKGEISQICLTVSETMRQCELCLNAQRCSWKNHTAPLVASSHIHITKVCTLRRCL